MVNKKKRVWIFGFIFIVICIVLFILMKIGLMSEPKFNADGEVEVHYKSTYVDAVPEDFRTEHTKKSAAEMFQMTSETGEERINDTLELRAVFKPNGEYYKAEGTGVLTISDKEYPFKITTSTLNKETLQSGDHFMWGTINGIFKDAAGKERDMILSIGTVIEKKEVFYYATLGGIVMSFGDYGYETDEIRDIILDNPL